MTLGDTRAFKLGLQAYKRAINQRINLEKSSIFFINTPERLQRRINREIEIPIRPLLTSYLGMSLFVGNMSKDLWNSIMDMIQRKLAGWKGLLLS